MSHTFRSTPLRWMLMCLVSFQAVDAIHVPPLFQDLRAKFRNATLRRRQHAATRPWNVETDEVPSLPPALPFSELWVQIANEQWFWPVMGSLALFFAVCIFCCCCCCTKRPNKPEPIPVDPTKES